MPSHTLRYLTDWFEVKNQLVTVTCKYRKYFPKIDAISFTPQIVHFNNHAHREIGGTKFFKSCHQKRESHVNLTEVPRRQCMQRLRRGASHSSTIWTVSGMVGAISFADMISIYFVLLVK